MISDSVELAELQARNRRMLEGLKDFKPGDGFDPEVKLFKLSLPAFGRQGHSTVQGPQEYALALLESGGDADLAGDIILATLKYQDLRDPTSDTYGNFFWMTNWPQVDDPNAVSFNAPHYVHIYKRHRDKLSPDVRKALERAFETMLVGLMRQPWCGWHYTNIFLLSTAGRFGVASLLRDERAITQAVEQWETWIDKTSQHGIPEFNSPTYSPIDIIGALGIIENAPDPSVRLQAQRAADYLLLEYFLHYHERLGMLTGASSRVYQDPDGTGLRKGSIGELIRHHQLGTPCPPMGLSVLEVAFSEYLAPKWIRDLGRSKTYPYTVDARSANPDNRPMGYWVRRNVMHEDYTVGTFSNGFYTILQMPVSVCYDSPKGSRMIYLHGEPELGSPHIDQLGDSVLAGYCYCFDDNRHRYGPVGPETHNAKLMFMLAQAGDVTEVLIDGKPWNGLDTALPSGTRLSLWMPPLTVGIVPIMGHIHLQGDDVTTDERPVRLYRHQNGQIRLELHLYRADMPAETAFPHVQAGFFLRVDRGGDLAWMDQRLASAQIASAFSGETWNLSAKDGGGELAVHAPLAQSFVGPEPKVGKNQGDAKYNLRCPQVTIEQGDLAQIIRGEKEFPRP